MEAPARTGTITANGDIVNLGDGSGDKASFVLVQLTGTWTGTVQFEATLEGTVYTGVAAIPVSSSNPVTDGVVQTTTNGLWRIDTAGLTNVRVRASAAMTGTLVVHRRPVIG